MFSGFMRSSTTTSVSVDPNASIAAYLAKQLSTYPPLVFNILTDSTRKAQLVPVFTGEFFKRGHSMKSWKKRKFQLSGRKLKYYDRLTFKGDFDIKDCSIELPPQSENGAPTPFQFVLHSSITKGVSLICCTTSEEDREQWVTIISAQSRTIAASAACMNCPPLKAGFLKKQGHLVRNWQNRFFVLDMGMLRYYEKESRDKKGGTGEGLKGSMALAGTIVKCEGADRIYIAGLQKDLLVQAEDKQQCDSWFNELCRHVKFADENTYLMDVESKE